jgi:hypothetical protein
MRGLLSPRSLLMPESRELVRVRSALDIDPGEVAGLPAESLPGLLAALAALQTAVAARLATGSQFSEASKPEDGSPTLIDVQEAAAMAGMTVQQFYRRQRFRRAVVKLGHRTLRVDERKLRRIIAETEA